MSLQRVSVRFTVPFVAGKLRARVQRVPGGIHSYTPDKTTKHMKQIAKAYRAATDEFADKGTPVDIYIEANRRLPKSRPKKVVSEEDIFKLDVDNIAKLVMDGLNGVAYDDDKQVVRCIVTKNPRKRAEDRPYMLIELSWPKEIKDGRIRGKD